MLIIPPSYASAGDWQISPRLLVSAMRCSLSSVDWRAIRCAVWHSRFDVAAVRSWRGLQVGCLAGYRAGVLAHSARCVVSVVPCLRGANGPAVDTGSGGWLPSVQAGKEPHRQAVAGSGGFCGGRI